MALLHLGKMQIQMQMKRGFSASSVLFYKDVDHKEEGKKIVVQGVSVASPNKSNVVTEGCREGRQHCHPFCRSPVVGQVKHTDVLLIDQFLTSTGEMYSQDELGICKRQWVRLKKLAEMAQRAGLMPGKEFYAADVRKTSWGSKNCYWDEKSIDIQWNSNEKAAKRREFRTGFFKKY